MRYWLVAVALLSMVSCSDVISDPPEFVGQATASIVSATQVSISWQAGTDDLNEAHELRYAIWFESGSENGEGEPDIVTNEGVLSYNLDGLTPETDYEVLVRVRDRGFHLSENDQTLSFTTPALGEYVTVTYRGYASIDDVVAAHANSTDRMQLGLVDGRDITWLGLGEDGSFNTVGPQFRAEENIADFVPFRTSTDDYDDFWILHPQLGLTRYVWSAGEYQRDDDFQIVELPFAGTIHAMDVDADGLLDLVFATEAGAVVIYKATDSDTWVWESTSFSGHLQPHLLVAAFDDDELLDLVIWSDTGVDVAKGEGDFAFETWRQGLPASQVGGTNVIKAAEVSGDGLLDLVSIRYEDGSNTLLHWWQAADLEFGDARDIEIDPTLGPFELIDWDGNLISDLIAVQSEGNNVLLFPGSSRSVINMYRGLGAVDDPDQLELGDFNGDGRPDLAVVDLQEARVSLVYTRNQ
ncbi:MAG: hypothetical protein KDC35_02290 [Acidobacteria bacterium]|nr:hypothetical protein [Acidobacteriota bacterium]